MGENPNQALLKLWIGSGKLFRDEGAVRLVIRVAGQCSLTWTGRASAPRVSTDCVHGRSYEVRGAYTDVACTAFEPALESTEQNRTYRVAADGLHPPQLCPDCFGLSLGSGASEAHVVFKIRRQ